MSYRRKTTLDEPEVRVPDPQEDLPDAWRSGLIEALDAIANQDSGDGAATPKMQRATLLSAVGTLFREERKKHEKALMLQQSKQQWQITSLEQKLKQARSAASVDFDKHKLILETKLKEDIEEAMQKAEEKVQRAHAECEHKIVKYADPQSALG